MVMATVIQEQVCVLVRTTLAQLSVEMEFPAQLEYRYKVHLGYTLTKCVIDSTSKKGPLCTET